ncbi:MAG: 7-carboxy-7-deazaguanine synthase QueE [Deltaproteobacteria bacterium]
MYPVVEIIGPTIQGEGINIGQRTMFVRLAGCDFRCRWCDTLYAIEDPEVNHMKAPSIVKKLSSLAPHCKTVTITGGNPCIHDLGELIHELCASGYSIQVETQGSIWQDCLRHVDMISLSPKPPSSGMYMQDLDLEPFMRHPGKVQLKMVILTLEDYQYAQELHQRYPKIPMALQACNETDRDTDGNLLAKYRSLVEIVANDATMSDGVRVLPQMHVLAWGNRK